MSTPLRPRTTSAFYVQSVISFGVSLPVTIVGVCYLHEARWVRAFLALGLLYVVTSSSPGSLTESGRLLQRRGYGCYDQRVYLLGRNGLSTVTGCARHGGPALTRETALAEPGPAPAVAGFHHFSPTVSDVEASAQWYERVFGMTRVPVTFPHYGDEKSGYAVLLMDPRSGIAIGLHHHDGNPGRPFDESCTGLDHMSFAVAERADLDVWANWLDSIGVENSGVIDTSDPMPYSVVVFRDPDNIQLELINLAG